VCARGAGGGPSSDDTDSVTISTATGLGRFAVALVCSVALVFRYIWGLGSITFTSGNFFSYLTIQSNIAFVAVLVVGGIHALKSEPDPPWLSVARAAVLSCTVSAGVVFAFLVQQAGARGFRIDVPWSDQVLHFWLPTIALLEWFVSPGRGRVPWRTLFVVIGYAVVWGIATLIRGADVGWYPYFFLDPAQVDGVGQFALFSGIALALFSVVTCAVVGISRTVPLADRRSRRDVARPPE